jgi:hypothetical protein
VNRLALKPDDRHQEYPQRLREVRMLARYKEKPEDFSAQVLQVQTVA